MNWEKRRYGSSAKRKEGWPVLIEMGLGSALFVILVLLAAGQRTSRENLQKSRKPLEEHAYDTKSQLLYHGGRGV
jgi:hypothetical protein